MTRETYPSFLEAIWIWCKISLYSFGGPTNQIAVMHKLIVEEKKWIGEKRFLNALNYCMLLPGPEAHQLIIYLGWLLHRYRGGIAAGIIFLIPGIVSILILSILYAKYQSLIFVQTLFFGIKAGVIAIVFDAMIHISKKALSNIIHVGIALSAFIGIFFFQIPFPLIIFSAALLGFIINRYGNDSIENAKDEKIKEEDLVAKNKHITYHSVRGTIFTFILWLFIWLLPTFIALSSGGLNSVFTQEGLFFTKTAAISFGGAYAVLAYITLQSVQYYHWLQPGEMLDGLGMAETMPGPLIKIVQFVGFLAAYRHAESINPLFAGVLGSFITAWAIFIPSFLWIFTGAPYIEILRRIKWLKAALTAITAAVVGVILNLTVWFTIHALFHTVLEKHYFILRLYIPNWNTFDLGTFIIMLCALVSVFIFRAGIFTVLISSVFLGFLIKFFNLM